MLNTIQKSFFLFLFLIFIIPSQAQQKPNVLFIAIDDLNDWVGCFEGHPQTKTPNIDRLARQGVRFTNAHCQAPICGPSRASIFTGLYPGTTGNYLQLADVNIKKANQAAAESTFMPDYFEQHGYKTLGVGKLYHNGDRAKTFDEYGGWKDGFGPKPPKRINFDPAWMGVSGGTQTDWGAYPEADSLMPDYRSAQWAVDQLGQKHGQAFFLAVGFVRPHVPWHVPQKWFDLFPEENIETPPYLANDFDDIPEMGARVGEVPMMPTTEWLKERGEWKKVVQSYLASIAFVDHQVGKVLDALENSAYASNTIVVLWSDHGYHLGEKNRFAKQALWQESTRVPLIIKVPDGTKTGICRAPVQLLDMYPTVVELCGLPAYDKAEGHSLAPLLQKPNRTWQHHALTYYGVGNFAVTGKRYRLIQYEDGSQELYDLKKDPNEWKNLAGNKKYKKHKAKLAASIPQQQAPLAKQSKYNINAYFREKVEANQKEGN